MKYIRLFENMLKGDLSFNDGEYLVFERIVKHDILGEKNTAVLLQVYNCRKVEREELKNRRISRQLNYAFNSPFYDKCQVKFILSDIREPSINILSYMKGKKDDGVRYDYPILDEDYYCFPNYTGKFYLRYRGTDLEKAMAEYNYIKSIQNYNL